MTAARMIHGIDLYAPGGLAALFAFHRGRFGDLRMDAEGEGGGSSGDAAGAVASAEDGGPAEATDGPKLGPNGFPLSTPWRQMEPEHQAAYWRYHARAKEDALKAEQASAADLRAKAQQFDALEQASKTESEREIDRLSRELAAAQAAQVEARRSFGTQLVETQLSAAASAKGLSAEALKTLAGDLGRFLSGDGVDSEAVDTFLAAVPDKVEPPRAVSRDFGGGRRESAQVSGVAAGAGLYAERHRKKQASA